MHMTFAKDQSPPVAEIGLRQFRPGDAAAFRRLNEEWITRFFRIEPKEEPILADPQATILDLGGRIFFATAGERCVGCCALIRIRDKEFEVAKMAVEPSYQRAGIGRRLIPWRVCRRPTHVRLYESVGFKHIDADRIVPSPYARADVYMELTLV
jgi:GNAT superfamily N-acetyltransferase